MLAGGCPLGTRCRWDSDCEPRGDGSVVTFLRPAWRITLWLLGVVSLLLAFLVLSDFWRDMSRIVSVTIHGATPDSDIDSGKVGKNLGAKLKRIKFSHPKIEMERRLQAVLPVGAARE